MRKQSLTKKEKDARFSMLSDMGCVICQQPPQIHHCKGYVFGCGMGQKADDAFTIPLCYSHHVGAEGIHRGVPSWEKKHGTQLGWLRLVNQQLKWEGLEP